MLRIMSFWGRILLCFLIKARAAQVLAAIALL